MKRLLILLTAVTLLLAACDVPTEIVNEGTVSAWHGPDHPAYYMGGKYQTGMGQLDSHVCNIHVWITDTTTNVQTSIWSQAFAGGGLDKDVTIPPGHYWISVFASGQVCHWYYRFTPKP